MTIPLPWTDGPAEDQATPPDDDSRRKSTDSECRADVFCVVHEDRKIQMQRMDELPNILRLLIGRDGKELKILFRQRLLQTL